MSLTGRFEFRRTWTGKIILQIEEEVKSPWPRRKAVFRRRWRNATVMDLANPEMRPLIDLRRRGRVFPSSEPLSRPEDAPVSGASGPRPRSNCQAEIAGHG
jgi:hypothetical protein